jgi:MarR family transcriptional regulator, repressor for mepA
MSESPTESGSLLSALRRAYQLGRRRYREHLAHLDLTPRQGALILAVQETPGIGLGAASEAIGADAATCSALVERLVERRLVDRRPDATDRRRTCLYLTDDATQIADGISASRRAAEEQMVAAIGADAAGQLRSLLEEMTARLEREAEQAGVR